MRPSKHALVTPASVPPDVEVVQVEQGDVPIYGEWIGTLDGLVNADVRAQVTGYLQTQAYQEGRLSKTASFFFRSTHALFRQHSPKANWHKLRQRSPMPRRFKAAPNSMSSVIRR
jgi:membrane fusion protein (multidrug efflux system)